MYGVARDLRAALVETQPEELRAFHEKWLLQLDERDRAPAKELVSWLFPSTVDALDTYRRRSLNELEIRRGRHAVSPDFYPLYFRLTLGDTVISRELVAGLIDRAAEPEAFSATLLELADEKISSGRTRASVMLDELVGQTEKFDGDTIPGVIAALLSVGDKLWIEGDEALLLAGNEVRIWFIVEGLLERIERDDRAPLLERAINQANSVATPTRIVSALAHRLGVESGSVRDVEVPPGIDENAPVPAAGVRALEEAAAQKIARAAEASEILDSPAPGFLMARWSAWASPADVSAWLDRVRADDTQLGRFLVAALQTAQTGLGETRYRLNPQWFADYVDREALATDVRNLEGSAQGDVAVAVRQFLEENAILDAGRDPDYPSRA
ncbi:MAG: hypothetical protein ACRDNP_00755 [Gaiellaceae bacterium]